MTDTETHLNILDLKRAAYLMAKLINSPKNGKTEAETEATARDILWALQELEKQELEKTACQNS